MTDYDNFLRTDAPESFGYFSQYMTLPAVRKALGVGNATFHSGLEVEKHLLTDFMVTLLPEFIQLLESAAKYRVLVYSGNLDVIIGALLTDNFVDRMQWSGAAEYETADRAIWYTPGNVGVSGYVRRSKNFARAVVRSAGHIVPYD